MEVPQKTYICSCWRIYNIMREIFIRALSGALYIVVLLGVILFSETTFLCLFFIFGMICLYELQRLLRLKSYLSYAVLFILIYFFSYLKMGSESIVALLILTLGVKLLLLRDLLIIRKISLFEEKKYLLAIFYLISSVVFLTLIPSYSGEYKPELLIGVFVLIWTNDTAAYLIGKNFGKHKLFERISPNKTIEGFLGGVIFSCSVSYLIYIFTNLLSPLLWAGLALVVSIFGTFGDLIQSKLKRQAGVKDSGTLMPGHGGLFDRLDSVLFAGTFVYGFLLIAQYVS